MMKRFTNKKLAKIIVEVPLSKHTDFKTICARHGKTMKEVLEPLIDKIIEEKTLR